MGPVIVPPAVAAELAHGDRPIDVGAIEWIEVRRPTRAAPDLGEFRLDPGEIEAISLALELEAEILLIDELAGRRPRASST